MGASSVSYRHSFLVVLLTLRVLKQFISTLHRCHQPIVDLHVMF